MSHTNRLTLCAMRKIRKARSVLIVKPAKPQQVISVASIAISQRKVSRPKRLTLCAMRKLRKTRSVLFVNIKRVAAKTMKAQKIAAAIASDKQKLVAMIFDVQDPYQDYIDSLFYLPSDGIYHYRGTPTFDEFGNHIQTPANFYTDEEIMNSERFGYLFQQCNCGISYHMQAFCPQTICVYCKHSGHVRYNCPLVQVFCTSETDLRVDNQNLCVYLDVPNERGKELCDLLFNTSLVKDYQKITNTGLRYNHDESIFEPYDIQDFVEEELEIQRSDEDIYVDPYCQICYIKKWPLPSYAPKISSCNACARITKLDNDVEYFDLFNFDPASLRKKVEPKTKKCGSKKSKRIKYLSLTLSNITNLKLNEKETSNKKQYLSDGKPLQSIDELPLQVNNHLLSHDKPLSKIDEEKTSDSIDTQPIVVNMALLPPPMPMQWLSAEPQPLSTILPLPRLTSTQPALPPPLPPLFPRLALMHPAITPPIEVTSF